MDRGWSASVRVKVEHCRSCLSLLWQHYGNTASYTLLPSFYNDVSQTINSRPSTDFIAFKVRLFCDIQDQTTTLRSPRRLYNDTTSVMLIILGFYYASSMIRRWCAYLLCFWNVFYFISRHEKRISDYLSVFVSTINKLNEIELG